MSACPRLVWNSLLSTSAASSLVGSGTRMFWARCPLLLTCGEANGGPCAQLWSGADGMRQVQSQLFGFFAQCEGAAPQDCDPPTTKRIGSLTLCCMLTKLSVVCVACCHETRKLRIAAPACVRVFPRAVVQLFFVGVCECRVCAPFFVRRCVVCACKCVRACVCVGRTSRRLPLVLFKTTDILALRRLLLHCLQVRGATQASLLRCFVFSRFLVESLVWFQRSYWS